MKMKIKLKMNIKKNGGKVKSDEEKEYKNNRLKHKRESKFKDASQYFEDKYNKQKIENSPSNSNKDNK